MGVLRDVPAVAAMWCTLVVAPAQAKFIGQDLDPRVMLPLCKDDIAQGRAGVCTGYVLGIATSMKGQNAICIPADVEYEDIVRAVVNWIELAFLRWPDRQAGRHMFFDTEAALRTVWACNK